MSARKKTAIRPSGATEGKTIVIAAGGTGGHITPGISVAEAWLAQGGGIVFATLMKNIDYPDIVRLARNENVTIVAYDAPRLTKNPLKLIAFLKRFLSAYRLIRQAATDMGAVAVLGMGGYSSFPSVAYAIRHRKALFLCEQNARWGIVTRLGKAFAQVIFLSFPHVQKLSKKFIVTGNPLRSMFTKPAIKKTKTRPTVLFLGGSQGANDINALYLASAGNPTFAKYHMTVAAGVTAASDIAKKARKGDTVLPFIEDMPAAYAAADFIVARCGSGTLFEILWSQKPAFLMPYPFAAANHQKANAEAMQAIMPCHIFDERPFDATRALAAFAAFLKNPPTVAAIQPKARAESEIARYIIENLNHAQKN